MGVQRNEVKELITRKKFEIKKLIFDELKAGKGEWYSPLKLAQKTGMDVRTCKNNLVELRLYDVIDCIIDKDGKWLAVRIKSDMSDRFEEIVTGKLSKVELKRKVLQKLVEGVEDSRSSNRPPPQ